MYPKILKNFIYPFIMIRYPNEKLTFNYLRLLEKTQWWSPQKLESFQKKRLREIIDHAYRNVPYYHKIFNKLGLKPEDIRSTSDLMKLPILTKEIIRKNLNALTAKNYQEGELIASYTGGYTGKRMKFYIDKKWEARNMAAAFREWSWAGYEPGDRMAYLWSAPQDLALHAEFKNKIYDLIMRRIILDAYNLSENTMTEYVRILKKFKPEFINAYASAIFLLAQYLLKRGIHDIRPKAILTSCEMLFDYQREIIEKAFRCDVFDYYSGRDTTLQAGECSEHSGYHMAIENAIVEFVKDNEHVAPGEFGKIIITDFFNYANPFIRYEIGDLGIPSDDLCSCRRGLPIMEKIAGRVTDIITTKEGKYLPGLFFIHIFDTKAIKQYQLIQKTKEHMVIKIIKGEDCSIKVINIILQKIREACGDIKIEVEFVNSIPVTKSGKHRFVISEVAIDI